MSPLNSIGLWKPGIIQGLPVNGAGWQLRATRQAMSMQLSYRRGKRRECAMSEGALIDWRSEAEAIHREMNSLFKAGWLETAAERQVRQVQYLALIERRAAAARRLLQAKI
jgi:hypothetical protein